jgi:glutamyl-tRNA synthetase
VVERPRSATLDTVTGRFAPSPTGDLHLGNLRTAALAWLSARSRGERFLVRMEDLDRQQASRQIEQAQLHDLRLIGLDWDGEVVRQSERFDRYEAAISELAARDLVYECFCSRRQIREEIAASSHAPHGPPGSYPGTCRDLTGPERARRIADGRPPALRLRTNGEEIEFSDAIHGAVTGVVDDVVLRRNDGVPAYNLAVVVDDDAQGVTEVVRGDDLLSSTGRQIHLQELLGLPRPAYVHVPLVVDDEGQRLAKRRDVPLTIAELAEIGVEVGVIVDWLASSLSPSGSTEPSVTPVTVADLVDGFDWSTVPREPVVVAPFVPR